MGSFGIVEDKVVNEFFSEAGQIIDEVEGEDVCGNAVTPCFYPLSIPRGTTHHRGVAGDSAAKLSNAVKGPQAWC